MMKTNDTLEERLAIALSEPVIRWEPVSGGDIAQSYLITTQGRRTLFAKTHAQLGDMLPKEATGLQEIATSKAIRVPQVVHVEEGLLVLEAIGPAPRPDDRFFRAFGAAVAAMHRHTADFYGFHEDNYIGSTVQKNLPKVNYHPHRNNHQEWAHFFFEYRLLFQYRLLEQKGYAGDLKRAFLRLEERVMSTVGARNAEQPALLHGDLWNGNYLMTPTGEPCLIDPAVYYGDREADLAMTTLFGGFDPEFYLGYQAAYPMLPDYREREPIYQLYHVMNHANMFGGSYYDQLRQLLNSLM